MVFKRKFKCLWSINIAPFCNYVRHPHSCLYNIERFLANRHSILLLTQITVGWFSWARWRKQPRQGQWWPSPQSHICKWRTHQDSDQWSRSCGSSSSSCHLLPPSSSPTAPPPSGPSASSPPPHGWSAPCFAPLHPWIGIKFQRHTGVSADSVISVLEFRKQIILNILNT